MRISAVRLLLGPLAFLAGCAEAPAYKSADAFYFQNQPDLILESYAPAMDDRSINALIGVDKMLSAALLKGDWRAAEDYAVRASTLVNIFLAGEQGERDALSLFGQEKEKPFKGEPHERVMADYYLGVLRFMERDYEGALAAFRSAMNHDRGSFLLPVEKEKARRGADNVERYLYEDTYALLYFLAAKCFQLVAEPQEAEKHLARARATAPEIDWLWDEGLDAETNVLVLIEAGLAPAKMQTGPEGAILGYAPGGQDRVESVTFAGEKFSFALCEDLFHHATTVGGRQVDELNQAKARKQEALRAAGFATVTAGYATMIAGAASDNRNVQLAGLIVTLVGVGTMIFADAAIDPSADVRAWTLLPGQIYLAVGRAPPGGDHKLEVRAQGRGDVSQTWTGVPVDEGVNLYWLRLLPGRKGGEWPGPSPPAPSAPPPASQEGPAQPETATERSSA